MEQRRETFGALMAHKGRCAGTLWFAWLGAVLGMPYLLGFSEPCDTVAYAGAYGFAASGILLGLIVCDAPGVLALLRDRTFIRHVVWGAGLVSTGLLGLVELARLGNLTFVYESLTGDTVWPHIWASTYTEGAVARAVTDAVIACLPFEKSWACVNGFLCAVYGCASGCVARGESRQGVACGPWAVRFIAGALGLAIGSTRMFAWTFLLPHASYPLAAADGMLNSSDVWDTLEPAFAIAPFLLVSLGAFVLARMSPQVLLPVLVGTCAGELAMRVVSRVVPGVLAISFPMAVGCLVVQVIAIVLAGCVPRLAGSYRFRQGGAAVMVKTCAEPVSDGLVSGEVASDLASALTAEEEALLAPYGLSAGEMNAVRAARLELSSSEAAEQLGVRPSTVRAQRVRACAKVGATSIEQLVSDLLLRHGPFAVSAGFGEAGARDTGARDTVKDGDGAEGHGVGLVGPSCLYVGGFGCLALLLLPYHGAATAWVSMQLTSLGCMCGLAVLAVARAIMSDCPSGFRRRLASSTSIEALPSVLTAIGLAMASCVLMSYRRGAYGFEVSMGVRFAVFVATVCLVVCGCLCLRRGRYLLAVSDVGCDRVWWVGAALLLGPVAACIGPDVWLVALIGYCLAAMFGCWACRANRPWVLLMHGKGENFPVTWRHCLLLGCLGFAWEESWRGQVYISLQEACVPMLAVVCAALIWSACRGETRPTGHRAALGVSVCVLVVLVGRALGATAALLLCCTVLAAFLPVAGNVPVVPRHHWCGACSRLAPMLGIAVGTYGVNAFGTELISWSSSFAPSAWALDSLIGGIVGCGLLIVSLGCVGGLVIHVREMQVADAFRASFDPDRLQSYLTGRGFSKEQADVVELLCQGVSVKDIALRLAYSRVAVDRMRRDAYAHLGVHSRMQLIEELTRAMTPPNKNRAR